MTYRNAMTTHEILGAAPRPQRSNAYTPPAGAKRRTNASTAPIAIEAPGEAPAGEPVPIFRVGYRKVRTTAIVFPDRRVRAVTPKIGALETISENKDLLLRFSDPKEAERQPLQMLREAAGIMREIVPSMVPDPADREFLLSKFDDEQVEDAELITQLLKAFAYLMGTLTGAKAVENPAARVVDECGHDVEDTDTLVPDEAEEFAPAVDEPETAEAGEDNAPEANAATHPQSNAYPHMPLDLPAHEATPAEEEPAP